MAVGLFNPAYANRMTGLFGAGANTGVVPPNRIPGVGNPPQIPGGTPAPAPHPMTVPAITTTNGIPNADSVNNASITANQQNSQYNNAMTHGNTTGPTGSQTFSSHIDPVTGATVYDQNISLPAAQQQVLNQQNQDKVGLSQTASSLLPQIASANSTPLTAQALQDRINMSGVTSQLVGADDLQGDRQQVQDALYNRQAAYLDPQYQQSADALRTQLSNQGIVEGSEAWNNAMDAYNRGKSFDYAQARNDAITGGLNEMQGLSGIALNNRNEQFGEANTDMQTHNDALQQQLARDITTRADPLNRYKALTDQASVTIPQFNNPAVPLAQNTDVSGNAFRGYEDQLAAQNAQNANSNAVKSGLFGLAGNLITSGVGKSLVNGVVDYGKGLFGVGSGAPSGATMAPAQGVTAQQPGEASYASQASNALGLGAAGAGAAAAGAGAGGAGAGALGAGTIGVTDLGAASAAPAIGTLGGAGAGAAGAGAGAGGAGAAGAGAAGAGGAGAGGSGAAAAGSGSGAGVGAVAGAAAVGVAMAYAVYQDWASNNGGLGRSGTTITLSNADGTGPGNIPIHIWDYQSKDPAVLKRYVNMAKIINQQKMMNANAAARGTQATQTV